MRRLVRPAGARPALALLLAVLLLLGGRRLALAHGSLVSSSPAAGSTVASAPTSIRLVFSEPLEPGLARVSLEDASRHLMPLRAAGDPHDVNAVIAPVDSLAPGAYRVVWRIVSADGHPVSGSYVFRVAPPPADTAGVLARLGAMHDSGMRHSAMHDTSPPEPAMPDESTAFGPTAAGAALVPAMLRGLAVGALMALAGLLAFVGAPARDAASRRELHVATWLAVAAPALLALHFAAWLVNAVPEHTLGAAMAASAQGSTVGRVELWRIGLALLALWAVGLARRPRLALAFAVAALAVSGATGHAAAIRPLLAVPAKAVHLLAAAAWLGGLLWLLLRDRTDGTAFARDAARVSIVALVSIIAVTVSGIAETLLFLPTPLDVLHSAYGAVVLAKVAGLAALALFGAHHRNRLLPRLAHADGAGALAGSVRREVAVMGAVVLLGGFLAYVPTPAAPTAHDEPASMHTDMRSHTHSTP